MIMILSLQSPLNAYEVSWRARVERYPFLLDFRLIFNFKAQINQLIKTKIRPTIWFLRSSATVVMYWTRLTDLKLIVVL